MRDDFDEVVADRFRLLDQVAIPDTWSKVRSKVLDGRPAEFAEFVEQDMLFAQRQAPSSTSNASRLRGWMRAAAVLLVVAAVVAIVQRSDTPGVVTTATPDASTPTVGPTLSAVESSLAAAIESAGVLIEPSADEVALASNTQFFQLQSGSTQVTTAATFASLLKCGRPAEQNTGRAAEERAEATCGSGWAYVTGSVDGGRVHRGVLGDANQPELHVLDARFFVAMESSPGLRRAPTAWLIDSVSGGYVELTWHDEPATVSSPEQVVVVSDGHQSVARNARRSALESGSYPEIFLPRVIDARDGTIRPLAVPENASNNLPVAQIERGRIWVGTARDGRKFGEEDRDAVQVAGVAYSDDGGATWTEVTVPAQLLEGERLAAKDSWGVSIAADGGRIAVTSAWSSNNDRYVYVSNDAGRSWSTVTVANQEGNGAHLYVLADKRLLLVRSQDPYVGELLVSTGPDWKNLERDSRATQAATYKTGKYVADWDEGRYVSVNRDGVGLLYFPVEVFGDGTIGGMPDAPPNRYRFSTDLINWRTIAVLDD